MSSINGYIVHVLIPARGGSKSIPRKNSKLYKQIPLIAHSINLAKQLDMVDKIVVSTDCKDIQNIAKEYGAEAPFLRPKEISNDFSTDIECFQHYLSWLTFGKQTLPDILIHLRPTYPERNVKFVKQCLYQFIKHYHDYDSLRTVIPVKKTPFKMYVMKQNCLQPLFPTYEEIKEPYNQVRQILPPCYLHNGYLGIIKKETIYKHTMTGNKIMPIVMDEKESLDIDTEEDWKQSLET